MFYKENEMSEAKSIQELNVEYSQLCGKAGQIQYQIAVLSDDLKLINEQIRELNLKAAAMSAKEAEEKKEA